MDKIFESPEPLVYMGARVPARMAGHSRVPERHMTRQSTENATLTADSEPHPPLRYNDA